MMYIENIFLLVALPLVACLFCVKGHARVSAGSLLAGMVACLLSAYVSSFIAQFVGANSVRAAVEIAPVVEEIAKLAPLLFYVMVMRPKRDDVDLAFIFVAVGFATMESAFYLGDNGTAAPDVLALRGLSAAMMHLVCGILMGFGFMRVWKYPWLRAAGTFGILCLVITYHGLYNLLIAAQGPALVAAVAIPLATLVFMLSARRYLVSSIER